LDYPQLADVAADYADQAEADHGKLKARVRAGKARARSEA
jgi:cytochrome c551/c552